MASTVAAPRHHLVRIAGVIVLAAAIVAPAPAIASSSGGAVERAAATSSAAVSAAVRLTLTQLESGFSSPIFVTHAGDGSGRLFVVEQGGRIKVITAGGSVLGTPMLDISGAVSKGGEQGLLGLAFHPQFASNGKFYVNFTNRAGDTAIHEYRLSPPSSNQASSGRRVMTIDQPYANHNGGMLAFAPDGTLLIATGDGGSAGDPGRRAQSLDSLLGKILRINVNGQSASRGYLIPASNPWVGKAGRDEIWARGLRNPWRISVDPANGALWIGDVGQNRYEEVNRSYKGSAVVGGRGLNYGWRTMEGRHCYSPAVGCSRSGRTLPMIEYRQAMSGEDNCSVTGGYVYRGSDYPSLLGQYVFGDFCSGRIWTVSAGAASPATPVIQLNTSHPISSFGVDERGELYLVSLGGTIYRVGGTG